MVKAKKLPYTFCQKGRWFFVRRQGGTGKVVWTPLGGDPAVDDDASRRYHRLRNGLPLDDEPNSKPKAYRIGALIDDFLDTSPKFASKKKATQDEYRRTFERIRAKNGDKDARRITRPAMFSLRDMIAKEESPRQADRVITMFSILFEHAIRRGIRTDNPAKGVERVNEPESHKPWPQWAIDGLRKHANPMTRTVFELCLGTAQRIEDVCGIEWRDVEDVVEHLPDGTEVRIPGVIVTQNKTGWRGWIPMSDTLAAYLSTLDRSLTTIACDPRGKPITSDRAQKELKKVRPLYGGEDFNWHGLRYNASEELGHLSNDHIGAITGHKSAAMIQKYAGHARQKKLAIEARKRSR